MDWRSCQSQIRQQPSTEVIIGQVLCEFGLLVNRGSREIGKARDKRNKNHQRHKNKTWEEKKLNMILVTDF